MGLPATTLKALALRRARPFGQFRQASSGSTDYGSLGCTHTCLQYLTLLWKGTYYTHDYISKAIGYPYGGGTRNRGLYPSEVQAWFTRMGLPYVVKFGLTAPALLVAAGLGPVGVGHSYSRWPEWKGYKYGTVTADGKPNGYAAPLGQAGANQLSGFLPPNDAHMGILLGSGVGASGLQVYAFEPNHGSARRPELPPYDVMTQSQFITLYSSYRSVLGRTLYAWIPTRSLPL